MILKKPIDVVPFPIGSNPNNQNLSTSFVFSTITHAVFTRDTFTLGKLTFLLYCIRFSIVK